MRQDRPRVAPVEARLATALIAAARAAGIDADIRDQRSHPWASATFLGAQHRVVLSAPRSPDLGRWAAALPETEWSLRGHVVASVALDRIEDDGTTVTLTLAILTLEEG